MKVLVLTHTSGLKFEHKNFTNETVISDVWRSFQASITESHADVKMSLPSFRKLLKDFGMVKGWTASVDNPVTSNAQLATRQASKRDEKRLERKRDKKAQRMAERSLKNGSRSFMKAQQPKATDEGGRPFNPKINPLFAAMLGSGLSGRGR